MDRLLSLYHSFGRWGNIVLLVLLILSGIANRFYAAFNMDFPDYKVELVIIVLALYFVYRIYKRSSFEFTKQRLFLILLILGLVFRIILAIHDFYDRPEQVSDYLKHERLGQRLAFEHEFYDYVGVDKRNPDRQAIALRNFRQPGLPAIFAVGVLIYDHPLTYAVIMILFSFGVLIAGYYLFRDLNNIAALISFLYLSVSPNMIFMASNSNTQLSFFFFIILLFIALKKYTGKFYQLLLIGALLAAEMYIRFNFLMVFIMVPFLYEMHKDRGITYFLSRLGYIYLVALILYSPWIIRNYMVYGKIRFMPTTGMGLYSSNVTYDYTNMGGFNGVPDSILLVHSDISEVEFDEAMNNEAIEFVKNNPSLYIKGLPFRMIKYSDRQDWTIAYFFSYTDFESGKELKFTFQSIENYLFWVILFLSLICLIRIKKIPAISVYILWAYLSYSMVLLPVSETRSRYNFPYFLFPVFAVALSGRKEGLSLTPVKV